ncbi:MAG: DUF456 family protein [Neisseriaceae bacterium]|nr:MAG: DUF456 family protein [Neisseriaceae bacterium]
MLTIILLFIATALVLIGFVGLVNPALPGLPLIFAALWIVAYAGSYEYISVTALVIMFVLTVIGLLFDYISGVIGAKTGNASKQAVYGSLIGSVVGIFFGLPGIFFGSTAGAMLGELLSNQNLLQTGKVGLTTFVGFVLGTVFKIAIVSTILLYVLLVHIYYWIF